MIDLTVVWAGIIGFAIVAYVVMDGFDLGIGILFARLRVGAERDTALNSIAPVWDGNETWLVMGGGGLLAAFPLAYAIILPATYPHMLTFPVQMALMSDRSFPLALPGLVHVRNRIEVLRAIGVDEPLDLEVWAEHFARHRSGAKYRVVVADESRAVSGLSGFGFARATG